MRNPSRRSRMITRATGSRLHEGTDAGDARRDEHRVGQRADDDDGGDETGDSPDAEAQHEGVLRADRDDQRQAGDEPRAGLREAWAPLDLGMPASAVELQVLQFHKLHSCPGSPDDQLATILVAVDTARSMRRRAHCRSHPRRYPAREGDGTGSRPGAAPAIHAGAPDQRG